MGRLKHLVQETGCGHCPAYRGLGTMDVRVQNFTPIPSRLVAQTMGGVWHALLASAGKGKFLIRRRENQAANACPLQKYEIRHIEAAAGEDLKPDSQAGKSLMGNRTARKACREMLRLMLLGQI